MVWIIWLNYTFITLTTEITEIVLIKSLSLMVITSIMDIFVCLLVSRITQELLDELPHSVVEGGIVQGRTFNFGANIKINGWIQNFDFPFSAGFPTEFIQALAGCMWTNISLHRLSERQALL